MIERIEAAAKACGLSVIYARVGEDNVIVDKVKRFPCMLIPFNRIYEEGEAGQMSVEALIYVFSPAPRTGSTISDLNPIVDECRVLLMKVVDQLRIGMEVEVSGITTAASKFTTGEAGVTATLKITGYERACL